MGVLVGEEETWSFVMGGNEGLEVGFEEKGRSFWKWWWWWYVVVEGGERRAMVVEVVAE